MVDIAGATASTYTLTSADLDQLISVKVTATNSAGNATATAVPTAQITSPPINTVAPVIGGAAIVGNVLTATAGTWTGSAPISYAYQWKRGSTNVGTNASTYTLVTADSGSTMTVVVTATNSAGNASATAIGMGPVVDASSGVWSILKLGGSGAITGIDIARDGGKVCRPDSGGAYRWNTTTGQWEPMVTTLSMPAADVDVGALIGTYALGIAPGNSSRVYMHYAGYIFRSNDNGLTWSNTTKTSPVFTRTVNWYNEANDNRRGDGPKMAVHPTDPNTVITSTAANGGNACFYTTDGGTNWVALPGVPASTAAFDGGSGTAMLVAFHPTTPTTAYIFSYGNGLYRTTTGVTGTWSLIASTPAKAYTAMAVSAGGKVFLVDALSTDFTVDIYSGSAWSVSPTLCSDADAMGVTINPLNANQVWVVTRTGTISYSGDAGVTWSGDAASCTVTTAEIPWIAAANGSHFEMYGGGASFKYDPVAGELWMGYGLGVVKATAPTGATAVVWVSQTAAIEESISTKLIKPPGGRPVRTLWDQGVFYSPATGYPTDKGVTHFYHAGWALDYCPSPGNTNVIVARVYEDTANPSTTPNDSGKSIDGGRNWTKFAAQPATDNRGGMIACGTDPNNYVIIASDNGTASMPPNYTTDGGGTWNAISISGVSSIGPTGWNDNYQLKRHILCSDRVQADTFYMYNMGPQSGSTSNPGVYRSTNKGIAWSLVHAGVFPGITVLNARLVAVPGYAGHLFYTCGGMTSTHNNPPPQRSTDFGVTWTALTSTGEVFCIGFGKPASGGYPAIYIAGYVGGVYGIYRSDDSAATWTALPNGNAPLGSFDWVVDITGDMDVFGDCYIALSATGFMQYKV